MLGQFVALVIGVLGGGRSLAAQPQFVIQPTNLTAYTEFPATLVSSVMGDPPVSIQWYFQSSTITKATNASLILTNVALNQAGNYWVVATNTAGSATSEVATVTVIPSPGTLDPSWQIGSGPNDAVEAVAPLPDGAAYVAGTFTSFNGLRRVNVARLLSNGSVDPTFRVPGIDSLNPATPIPNSLVFVGSVVPEPGGKVLIGGRFSRYLPQSPFAPFPTGLLRLNPDGSLDSGFALNANPPTVDVYGLALTPDSKILCLEAKRLVRYNPDGTVDNSFGVSNTFNLVAVRGTGESRAFLAVQPDGKVIVGGSFTTYQVTNSVKYLIRLNPDGSLDSSFVPPAGFPLRRPSIMTTDDTGRLVVGTVGVLVLGDPNFRVVTVFRLLPDGPVDSSFNVINYSGSSTVGLAALPGGWIHLGGAMSTNFDSVVSHLNRVNGSGAFDPRYRPKRFNGSTLTSLDMRSTIDGKTLVGGAFSITDGGTSLYGLIRIMGDPVAPVAPSFVSHPTDVSRLGGSNFFLNATVAGTPPVTYQWLRDDSPLPADARMTGLGGFVLSVSNALRTDTGLYRLVASNAVGRATSDVARVEIRTAQQFLAPVLGGGGSFTLRFADRMGGGAGPSDLSRLRVETSTNLIDWVELNAVLGVVGGIIEVLDPDAGTRPATFYRTVER